MAVFHAIVILWICLHTQADLTSPCPDIFNYLPCHDPRGRWYGLLNLTNKEFTVGVRFKFTLDKPALQLGNLIGEAITYDFKEFIITDKDFRLSPNSSHDLRFFVDYEPNNTAPALVNIEQNDKRICPDPYAFDPKKVFLSRIVTPIPKTTLPPVNDAPIKESTNEVECGTIAAQASPLIIGGKESDVGSYPWHVGIFRLENGTEAFTCSGSLVSKKLVITTSQALIRIVDNENVEVHLGKHYRHETNPRVQIRKVSHIIRHPLYKGHLDNYNNNLIALLKLKEPAIFNDFVRPVCLSPPVTENIVGKIGTIPGWGATETDLWSEELRYANMKVVSDEDCLSNIPWYSTITGSFCAGPVSGSTLCRNDFGGGFVFADEPNGRRIYHLRGIFARTDLLCNVTHYKVFTDVAPYLNFIKANL